MITRDEIYGQAAKKKVAPNVIEKDYHLGIVLKIISEYVKTKSLIFRGGTALKKCYFSDYRFSEDLDFTLTDRIFKDNKEVENVLKNICNQANQTFGTALEFFNLTTERDVYEEEALKAVLHFPGTQGKSKIKVDLSFVDKVFIEPVSRVINHNYSDNSIFQKPKIKTARLEEIITDKIMATTFIRTYPRNRDLFDIWHIAQSEKLNLVLIKQIFEQKCNYRQLDTNLVYKIDAKHLNQFKKYWQAQLVSLVGDLPTFEEVVSGVVDYVEKIFGKSQ